MERPINPVRQRSKYLEEYSKQTATSRSCDFGDIRNAGQCSKSPSLPTSPARQGTDSPWGAENSGSETDKDKDDNDLYGFIIDDDEQEDNFRGLGGWDDSEVGIISIAYEEQLLQPLPQTRQRPQTAHVGGLRPERLRAAQFLCPTYRSRYEKPSWLDLKRFGDGSEESGSCSDNSVCHVRARKSCKSQPSSLLFDKEPYGPGDRAAQIGRLLQYPTSVPKKPPIPNVARCRRQLKTLGAAAVGERLDSSSGSSSSALPLSFGRPRLGRRAGSIRQEVAAITSRHYGPEEEEEGDTSPFSGSQSGSDSILAPFEPSLRTSRGGESSSFGPRRTNGNSTSLDGLESGAGLALTSRKNSLDSRGGSSSSGVGRRRSATDRALCPLVPLDHTEAIEKLCGSVLDLSTEDKLKAGVHGRDRW
eukprot:CAMPEP_0118922948 /NCGR_PEP_ID=MMETSP1169-20130426/1672_1 /TAXON_ID=36882 /ORGANISM="Pyramimonas obovata, Strain CCMP722" /LENGTH=417 /DNA_ID=CAMNT_0006863877 /DNA_START=171 /DNA_END=1421 /DNA_ORIENTATION=+